jgi:hypothetical protein
MSSIRDEVTAASGHRWWIPTASFFVGPSPSTLPGLSRAGQQIVIGSSFIDIRVPFADYLARFRAWDQELPGRAWQLETGRIPDRARPRRPFYPGVVTITASENVVAERSHIDHGWLAKSAATDAILRPLSDESAEELRRSDNSHLPRGMMQDDSLRSLRLMDNPVPKGRPPFRHLPVLCVMQSAFEAVVDAVARLGWKDLLFQCGGPACFRGVKLPPDSHDPNRHPRAAQRLSNHSDRLALDFNTFESQQNSTGAIDRRIVAFLEGFRFLWGRCFPISDPKHFEYRGAPC